MSNTILSNTSSSFTPSKCRPNSDCDLQRVNPRARARRGAEQRATIEKRPLNVGVPHLGWPCHRRSLSSFEVSDESDDLHEFTDDQLAMMIEHFDDSVKELSDLLRMFVKYSQAGGRDIETFTLILDRIAREGIKLSMCSRVPLDAGSHNRAAAVVAAAAAGSPIETSENRRRIHEEIAASALTTACRHSPQHGCRHNTT